MKSNELQLHTEEIIDNYINNKKSITQMAKEYDCKRFQIYYILEKNGIPRKSNSEANRRYTIDENYFDVIDTPEKAYVLGFLFADGYNNNINNSIVLSLNQSDYQILEDIKELCHSNKPLYFYEAVHRDGVMRYYANMTLCSKHMCDSLNDKGMVPNKSLVLDFPKGVPDEYMSHFYRGYFDGDGCFHHYSNPRYNNRNLVQLTSSAIFCEKSKEYLNHKLGVHFYITDAKHWSSNTKNLRISSHDDVKTFLDWIYQDASIKLQRKYDLYIQYVKK